jgi:P4 family phage/plasmid primase-like protien
MADINNPLIPALIPLTRRVRRDVTAVKRADGVQAWTREPLTRENLARHLNGGPARGVCPILAGQSVTLVALLDFDSHGGETPWGQMSCIAAGVFDVLALAYGCEPLAFRSSGGRGIHLYLLWDEPQDARSVRHWLGQVLQLCDLRNGTGGVAAGAVEVFPKQDHVPADGFGNQFILPLAGKGELLEFEDLSVSLIPAGRALAATDWRASPGVPVVAPAPRPEAHASDTPAAWRDALAAITAGQKVKPLSYDEWRDCVFAIHYETDGAGLALAHEMSAASSKYDPAFLDTRVWPYVRDRTDGAQVTGRTLMALARDVYGWTETLDVEAFPVMADVVPAAPPKPAREVPESLHLCTDQRNAQRLERRHQGSIMCMSRVWFGWDGKVWEETKKDIYRKSLGLSRMVQDEANRAREGLPPNLDLSDAKVIKALPPEVQAQAKKVAALEAWSVRCENKATIEAAIGLLQPLCGVKSEALDAHPMLLNCQNGVVDLRTGALQPHDPALRLTQYVPIDYDPEAVCPEWESALHQIAGERGEISGFLRRWFGYCLTGSTREQVFVAHYGDGSNGKSLVMDLMAKTAGTYAASAPSGMMAATKYESIKDTELAVLRGRRMVTAHETREGVELREDFVKMASGGDRITARRLYSDEFEFAPTHKLQILTNHLPTIKGQDHGIWRRTVLVPYAATFGARVGDVLPSGAVVTHVQDKLLDEKLSTPEALRGILAWRVRGCMEWLRDGLQIPDSVRAAGEKYRSDMDRVGQFVDQCCETGKDFSEPLTVGLGGLFPAYVAWCKDSNYHALGRGKFLEQLARHVPGLRAGTHQSTVHAGEGKRRKVTLVPGIRLLHE